MNQDLRHDAEEIVRYAIDQVRPDRAIERALSGKCFSGRVFLIAAGKAAWQMAYAAIRCIECPIEAGIVITKYAHVKHTLPGITCYEGGHPIPDEHGIAGTQAALDLTANLSATDTVLFLLSGGASALFEKPRIALEELQYITGDLLAKGADIVEINTLRKRFSYVKGGRFAQWCAPAQVHTIVLSDVLGDPLDMIASGPTVPDFSTCAMAKSICKKYQLSLSNLAQECLEAETPKALINTTHQIIGSVRELCIHAEEACRQLGYEPVFLTDRMCCEAREAGSFLSGILASHAGRHKKMAFLAGGETVVHLSGNGLGGRNQELALSAAFGIQNLRNAALISVGSDGTDGPTDAAGGYVDGDTIKELFNAGISYTNALKMNDSYHALDSIDNLIRTGPTGTNVNDITVGLVTL